MTVDQVAQLFPNLMDIQDAALRANVAAVWSEAIETGCGGKGWTTDELRAVPFTLLAGDIDLRYVEHLNSCCKQCIAIAGVLGEVFGEPHPDQPRPPDRGVAARRRGQAARVRQGRVRQGHQGPLRRDAPPPVLRRRPLLQARHPRGGHAHRRDPLARGRRCSGRSSRSSSTTPTSVDFDIAKYLGRRRRRRK
ncbi:MAG: hypothetical protein R3B49_05235 [Phycisphaerales bacterium]